MNSEIFQTDSEKYLFDYKGRKFDLSFLDPPFNQGKDYDVTDDNMPLKEYWDWMSRLCKLIYENSSDGASIYFMQREKNAQFVLEILKESGWYFQNLIIWKKKTSAVPANIRYGKHYQIIVFATKGKRPRVFNKLRIDPPLLITEKYHRPNGMFVTDVWDDIRELTSGYFAGDEPLRTINGERFHKQQAPIRLLARIILSSTLVNDLVFDPFAGTGTTLIVAEQLNRLSIGTELDQKNVSQIKERLSIIKNSDRLDKVYNDYLHTPALEKIWGAKNFDEQSLRNKNLKPKLKQPKLKQPKLIP